LRKFSVLFRFDFRIRFTSPDNLITVADVGDLSQQWGKIDPKIFPTIYSKYVHFSLYLDAPRLSPLIVHRLPSSAREEAVTARKTVSSNQSGPQDARTSSLGAFLTILARMLPNLANELIRGVSRRAEARVYRDGCELGRKITRSTCQRSPLHPSSIRNVLQACRGTSRKCCLDPTCERVPGDS